MRGFVLSELVVSTGISAVIAVALLVAFKGGQISWRTGGAQMAASYEVRRGLDAMSRELLLSRSDQVDVPADGSWYGSIIFHVPKDQNGDGTVLDANGALEWSPTSVSFSLGGTSGDQILRTQGPATRVLANGVQTLQFRRVVAAPDRVEILMTVRRGSSGDFQRDATLNTTVRLRN